MRMLFKSPQQSVAITIGSGVQCQEKEIHALWSLQTCHGGKSGLGGNTQFYHNALYEQRKRCSLYGTTTSSNPSLGVMLQEAYLPCVDLHFQWRQPYCRCSEHKSPMETVKEYSKQILQKWEDTKDSPLCYPGE